MVSYFLTFKFKSLRKGEKNRKKKMTQILANCQLEDDVLHESLFFLFSNSENLSLSSMNI